MTSKIKEKLEHRPVRDGDFVLPGTKLAIVEEFLPGKGTYVEQGHIVASVLGTVRLIPKKHLCYIDSPVKTAPVPKVGQIAIGQVSHTSKQMATIDIYALNEQPTLPTYTALIHISQITRGFVESMDDVLRAGDIVRCKVVDAKTIPLQVEMIGTRLGVIYATCTNCGTPIIKKERNVLECPACKTVNYRKTAVDYGVGIQELET